MGHLADSDGRVRDSRSQGHEFEYHVGCKGYLYKLNLKKKDRPLYNDKRETNKGTRILKI